VKRFPLILLGTIAIAFLVRYDYFLLTRHAQDVTGNLEASVIWGTPTAVLFFVRSEWRHRQVERAAQARHQERMEHLDSLHAKVDALHAHLGIEPPPAD
jgi:hypothetical protein